MSANEHHVLERASRHAAAYLDSLASRRVQPSPQARAGLARFDEPLPDAPSDPGHTVDLLHDCGSPATTATAGGRFFGLVVGGTLPASLGAHVLATAWDQIVFSESTSPVGVKLEAIAAGWLLDVLDLPRQCSVGFVTGATMANFTCYAAARTHLLRRLGYDVERLGTFGAPKLRIIVSDNVHVSAVKALRLLGFGDQTLERVATDDQGRIVPDAMPTLDETCLVSLNAGLVTSGAFDPFEDIADRSQESGAWVHVDGAFGLWAAASPDTRHLTSGVKRFDSWAIDGHKWLNTPYDCGIAICREARAVHASMATAASYLDDATHAAPKDMVPEFSRRARGVDVWAALRSLGRQGIADLVSRCCRHARTFERGLRDLGFDILNEVTLNQVVATIGSREQVDAIIDHCQRSGRCWFGPVDWAGRRSLRISVSSWRTTTGDVQESLDAIAAAKHEVLGS